MAINTFYNVLSLKFICGIGIYCIVTFLNSEYKFM